MFCCLWFLALSLWKVKKKPIQPATHAHTLPQNSPKAFSHAKTALSVDLTWLFYCKRQEYHMLQRVQDLHQFHEYSYKGNKSFKTENGVVGKGIWNLEKIKPSLPCPNLNDHISINIKEIKSFISNLVSYVSKLHGFTIYDSN